MYPDAGYGSRFKEPLIKESDIYSALNKQKSHARSSDFLLTLSILSLIILHYRILRREFYVYARHTEQNSRVLPALIHIIRFALLNNMKNLCIFLAIPRYAVLQ